jgi:hypothetical protein
MKFIDLPATEVDKFTVRNGDILFNRTNSADLVGKTAVFRESNPYVFAGYLVRLRVNEKADPEYVSAYLNSPYGKAILRGMCRSIIGMANINPRNSARLPFQSHLASCNEILPSPVRVFAITKNYRSLILSGWTPSSPPSSTAPSAANLSRIGAVQRSFTSPPEALAYEAHPPP